MVALISRWRRAPQLSCRELVELVTDYFEDALDPGARRNFDAHIAACGDCAAHLEQLRGLHSSLGRLAPEDLPERVEQEMRQALRDWRSA